MSASPNTTMQNKYRLYERYNRTFYPQEIETGRRETLKTKDKPTAELKLSAMNQAASQPAFNREMARVYLRGTEHGRTSPFHRRLAV